jgi:hypothetical protein
MDLKPIIIPDKKEFIIKHMLSPIKRYPIKDNETKSPNKYDILSNDFIFQNQLNVNKSLTDIINQTR